MSYTIRTAIPEELADEELADVVSLLPRLANFNVPEHRTAESLWHGDRDLIQDWAAGNRADVVVLVALINDEIAGVAVASDREELLSHEPAAHLEVLLLAKSAEGNGIGTALLSSMEAAVVARGARSLSLHVFANNTRARALYERTGFDGEIMRYYKPLG
jgi:ribosomal protein S18 acetylase RimI-like enzyme